MKNYIIIIALSTFCYIQSFCQNIIVNQYNNSGSNINNSSNQQICGIPTSLDIGGVAMQTESTGGYFLGQPESPWQRIIFTNYNSVPVTVLYEYYDARDGEISSGAIVLNSQETKTTEKIVAPSKIKMIAIQNGIKTNNNCIGGVQVIKDPTGGYYLGDPYYPWYRYSITNYNDFSVTVSYECNDKRSGLTSGTIVLQPKESKYTNKYVAPTKFNMKVRKLN